MKNKKHGRWKCFVSMVALQTVVASKLNVVTSFKQGDHVGGEICGRARRSVSEKMKEVPSGKVVGPAVVRTPLCQRSFITRFSSSGINFSASQIETPSGICC